MAYNPDIVAAADVGHIHRDGMDSDAWAALWGRLGGTLGPAGVRVDFESAESQPQLPSVLNPDDFIRLAEAGGNKNTLGIGVYQALVRAFRAEDNAAGDHPYFCVKFGINPDGRGEYWETRDLDTESLREFVRRVDDRLALIPTRTQQDSFFKSEMPFGIGSGVVEFCRRLLLGQPLADQSQPS